MKNFNLIEWLQTDSHGKQSATRDHHGTKSRELPGNPRPLRYLCATLALPLRYVAMIFAVLVMSMANIGMAWGADHLYFWFSKDGDATTNSVTNNENSFFGSTPSGSSSASGSVTIDGTTYTITQRSSNSTASVTFTIPANKTGKLYAIIQGSSSRSVQLKQGGTTIQSITWENSVASHDFDEVEAGTYTVTSSGNVGWCMLAVKVSDATPGTTWYVKGGWNSWGTTDNFKGSGTEITAKVNITTAGKYEFKIFDSTSSGTWWGNGGNIGCNVSGWTFESPGSNCTFFASETGNYTFTFNTSTKKLSVTYPTAQGKYYYKNTGSWSNVAVYRFKGDINNGWPGSIVVETEEICGDTYYFTYADPGTTLIFNNNDGGSQTGNMAASGNAGQYVAGTGNSWTAFTYNVTYDKNGGTGTAPTDATNYSSGASVPVKDNSNLTKSGYYFAGWNTKADGSGDTYVLGQTFSITSCTTLYAKWVAVSCPDGSETATVYSLTSPTGTVSVPASSSVTITSSQATVSKGMATMINGQGSTKNIISSDKINFGHNNTVLRLNLGCALAAGDVISFTNASYKLMVSKTNSTSPGTNNFVVQPSKTENCTIPAGSNLIGLKEVYVIRAEGSTTTFTSLTITRPAGCNAPSALAKSSVTASGVTLTVTDANDVNDYEFYVATASTAPTSGSTATHTVTDSKSKAITGLAFSTTYYAWARTKCGASNKSDWTALTGSTFTTSNTAPASPAVNPSNGWIYVPGESITLTASATASTINSSTTYTWYKGSTLVAAKAAGAIQASATAASGGNTYTIASCVGADAGKYWCEISNGSGYEAQASYDIKIFYFNLFDNNHDAIDNYVFTSIDRTNNKISISVDLDNTNYTYYFKVSDGVSTWFGTPSGNDGACITGSTPYLDNLQTGAGNNIGLTSSFADSYRLDFYYNSRNVVVTYPIHNQTEDVMVYFDNHLTEMDNIYLRIGHDANNKATSAFTLVPGTANLYVGATTSFDNFHAWSIADNTGKTGAYTIYQPWDGEWDGTGNTGQMSKQTNYQHSVVEETITIIPTSENNEEYDCQYYNVDRVSGMKTDRVTISSYSNGTITVNYTDTEDEEQSFTSGYQDLAHTVILTSITAVPNTGYDAGAITINEGAYSANYVVTGATTVAASFTPQTYSITYKDQGNVAFSGSHVDSPNAHPTSHTYATATTLNSATKTGYTFGGWYTSVDCSTGLVNSLGATDYTANITLYAKWTAKQCTVSFDNNGGTGTITSVTATYDASMPSKAGNLPTKDGYDFAGFWDGEGGTGNQYYNADGSSAQNWDKDVTATQTLYAKWTAHTYTVSLELEGGSGTTSISPVYMSDLGTSAIFSAPSLSNYTFGGFYTGRGGTGTQIINKDRKWVKSVDGWTDGTPHWIHTSDETLYAHWYRDYTIDDHGGSADGKVRANYKGTMGAITEPTYAGCTPDGYYAESGCSTLVMATDGTLESNVTNWTSSDRKWIQTGTSKLYAHWKIDAPSISCSKNTVTISTTLAGTTIYYTTNGSDPTTSSSVYSAPFAIAANTTVKAYAVKSSFTDSEIATQACSYETTYTVSYEKNGGSGDAMASVTDLLAGDQVTTSACTYTNSGNKFKWWNTATNGSGEDFYVGEKVTIASADVPLYAQWESVGTGEEFWVGDNFTFSDNIMSVGDMRLKKNGVDSNTDITKDYNQVSKYSSTAKKAKVLAMDAADEYLEVYFSDGSAINELKLGTVHNSSSGDKKVVVIYSTTADFTSGSHEEIEISIPTCEQSSKSVTDFSPSTEDTYTHARIYRSVSSAVYSYTGPSSGGADKMRIYSIKAKKGVACEKPILNGDPGEEVDVSGEPTHNSATLTWDEVGAVAGTKSYKIYLEVKSTHEQVVGWTPYDLISYNATGLSPATEYTFKVQPIGDPSDEVHPRCEEGDIYSVDFSTVYPVYTVTYNPMGGTCGTERATTVAGKVTLPSATNSTYSLVWVTSNGTEVGGAGDEYAPTADVTLYAKWSGSCAGGGGSGTTIYKALIKTSGLNTDKTTIEGLSGAQSFTTSNYLSELDGGTLTLNINTAGQATVQKDSMIRILNVATYWTITLTGGNSLQAGDIIRTRIKNQNGYLQKTSGSYSSTTDVELTKNIEYVTVVPNSLIGATTLYLKAASGNMDLTYVEIYRPSETLLYMHVNDGLTNGNIDTEETKQTAGESNLLRAVSGGDVYTGATTAGHIKIVNTSEIQLNNNTGYIKLVLPKALAEGDVLYFRSSHNYELAITSGDSRDATIHTANKTYTIPADGALKGKSTIYLWYYSSSANVKTLAVVRPSGGSSCYTVTYEGNGADGGYTNDPKAYDDEHNDVVVLPNGYTRTGYEFVGWNTAANGSGTPYEPGATISDINDDVTLYAQWRILIDDDNTDFSGYTMNSTDDVRVADGATLTITSTRTIHDIIIETGSTLNVNTTNGDGTGSGVTFTVNSLHLRGGWNEDKSTYDMPRVYINPASSLAKTSNTVNLDISVDQSNYYPIAVPYPVAVSAVDYVNETLAGASTYGTHYVIKEYRGDLRAANGPDQANNWTVVGADQTLQPGKGYIMTAVSIAKYGGGVIRFPMTVANGWTTLGEQDSYDEVTKNQVTVTAHTGAAATASASNKGWNILGVPYMSCFDASDASGSPSNAVMKGKLDFVSGNYSDGENIYVTVPVRDFSEYIQKPVSEAVLLPGWCFFVQIDNTGTLTFSTAGQEQSSSLPIYAPKREQEYRPTVKTGIILSGAEASDKTTILVSDKYSAAEYEINADLEKMFGSGYTLATYSLSGSTRLAYNAMSTADAGNVIPIGYRAPANGEYTFSLDPRYAESGAFERVDLIDYETGFVTDLLLANYTFDSERTQNDSRFAIHIVKAKEVPTDINEVSGDGLEVSGPRKVIINDKVYIIRGGQMYSVDGALVVPMMEQR